MLNRFAVVPVFAFGMITAANACGPGTVELVQRVAKMEKAPLYKCGPEFNDMLVFVQKHEWKAALAAYEAHLGGLGKWEAGSDSANETIAFLRQKVAAP